MHCCTQYHFNVHIHGIVLATWVSWTPFNKDVCKNQMRLANFGICYIAWWICKKTLCPSLLTDRELSYLTDTINQKWSHLCFHYTLNDDNPEVGLLNSILLPEKYQMLLQLFYCCYILENTELWICLPTPYCWFHAAGTSLQDVAREGLETALD